MDMNNGLRCRLAVAGAMQMRVESLRDEKTGPGKLVSPSDKNSLPAADLERGPGKLAGIAPKPGRRQVTVEALTNGPGCDIVERTAFQYADRSRLMQPRQGIDKFPQDGASRLPAASSVSPDRPGTRCNEGPQPTRQPKQTSPRNHCLRPLIERLFHGHPG
jgi:hypothetical protein